MTTAGFLAPCGGPWRSAPSTLRIRSVWAGRQQNAVAKRDFDIGGLVPPACAIDKVGLGSSGEGCCYT